MRYLALGFIYLYKIFVSPLLGQRCRFFPTCSAYGLMAYKDYDFVTATKLVLKRVGRCHPWGGMGHDPLPKKQKHQRKNTSSVVHAEAKTNKGLKK